MLKWIRPRWLRAIVQFIAPVLLGLGGAVAVIGIAYLVAAYVPPFRTSDPQQQAASASGVLGVFAIATIAVSVYLMWRRARAKAWFKTGLSLTRERSYQEALAAYEQTIAIIPRSPHAWGNKGVTLVRLGRYDEALTAVDHALKLDPTDPLAWNNKADILCEDLKRYDDAIAVCDAARKRHIETPGLWAIRAEALHALGREDEKRAAYERVLQFRARDFLGWAARSDALAALGRYDEALAAYDRALALGLDHPRVWRKKSAALRALGREDDAQRAEAQAQSLGQEV